MLSWSEDSGFLLHYLLDSRAIYGMGPPMNHHHTHPARCKTVDECPEILLPPRRATARTGFHDQRETEPKAKVLTLAEFRSRVEEVEREERLWNESHGRHQETVSLPTATQQPTMPQ